MSKYLLVATFVEILPCLGEFIVADDGTRHEIDERKMWLLLGQKHSGRRKCLCFPSTQGFYCVVLGRIGRELDSRSIVESGKAFEYKEFLIRNNSLRRRRHYVSFDTGFAEGSQEDVVGTFE